MNVPSLFCLIPLLWIRMPSRLYPVILLLLVFSGPEPVSGSIFSGEEDLKRGVPQDSIRNRIEETSTDSIPRVSDNTYANRPDQQPELSVLTREDLTWKGFRYPGEVLGDLPGLFLREQSTVGQYSQLSMRGANWRSQAILLDGRPVNDPASGIYHLVQFATEYADRIEVITGPRSFLYGLNGSGGSVNFVPKKMRAIRPYSKINYSESSYNYSYADGVFSQNISQQFNVTLGFQQQSTDGRFENSAHEAWNARVGLRYQITPNMQITFSDYFTYSQTELNGGINYSLSSGIRAFEPIQAVVNNADSYEKITRHDIDLAFIGQFLPDTSDNTTFRLYYSRGIREYRDEENRSSPNGVFIQSDHTSSWMGATLTQGYRTGLFHTGVGGTLEIRQIEGSPNLGRRRNVIGSLHAKEEIRLDKHLVLAGYGRLDHYLKESYAGGGADARLMLGDDIVLFAGFSSSRRVPTYTELFWTDSTVRREEPLRAELHKLAETGIEFSGRGTAGLRFAFFHRSVKDGIVALHDGDGPVFPRVLFANMPAMNTYGLESSGSIRWSVLLLEGTASYIWFNKDQGLFNNGLPRFWTRGGIYFRQMLLDGDLDLKAGFRGLYSSGHRGLLFNPEVLVYVPNSGPEVGGGSIDFVLVAHIGSAYIRLIWENLGNSRYFATPYYPAGDRAFRLGLSWEFLD